MTKLLVDEKVERPFYRDLTFKGLDSKDYYLRISLDERGDLVHLIPMDAEA